MNITEIKTDKKRFLPLLLLGDEEESMIDRYLSRGVLLVGYLHDKSAAVCVYTDEGGGMFELRSHSLFTSHRLFFGVDLAFHSVGLSLCFRK